MSNSQSSSAAPEFPLFSEASNNEATATKVISFDGVKKFKIKTDDYSNKRKSYTKNKSKKEKALYGVSAGPREMNEYERRLASKIQKYQRIDQTNVAHDFKGKKHVIAFKKTEDLAAMAARKAARAEILNTEESG
ncbi:hypothetical protein AYI69_g2401 [Smittium culicis]|uniref:Uncharacterized protein n=1 Tax=Smittium culicis TaxID=133412 RepID=A0A1R1YMI0_9FUNG|nr:hypothetical protein AYI69_g2401 [Smittium culicis]